MDATIATASAAAIQIPRIRELRGAEHLTQKLAVGGLMFAQRRHCHGPSRSSATAAS